MRPKDALGRYGCVPLDLHPDWVRGLSLHARLIGLSLISLCKDPGNLRLPVGADWKDSLCTPLAVNGPDRRNAKAALQLLVDRGCMTVELGYVRLHLTPVLLHSGSTPDPVVIHSGSTPDPKHTQVAGNTQNESGSYLDINLSIGAAPEACGEEAGYGEVSGGARPPLPDAPADLKPAELPIGQRILEAHAREFKKRNRVDPTELKRAQHAVALGRWCDANAATYAVTSPALARKLLKAFFDDADAARGGWLLSWALNNPTAYVGRPPGAAPLPELKQPTKVVKFETPPANYSEVPAPKPQSEPSSLLARLEAKAQAKAVGS